MFLLASTPTFAATVYLQAIADTSLLEAFPNNNFGGQTWFNSGTTQNYTTNRGLLKFDVGAAISRGSKITSATLTLEVVGIPVDGDNPSTFHLHRVLRGWGEGNKSGAPPQLGKPAETNESNWTYRFAYTTNTWGGPGGQPGVDYDPESSGDTFIYGIDFSPYNFSSTPRMLANIQDWLRFPELNFGWMLITQDEASNFTARRFASREDGYRGPVLTVDYIAPVIGRITVESNTVRVEFIVEAGWPYTLENCENLVSDQWHVLTNIPPQMTPTTIEWAEPVATAPRYYRLRLQ